MTDLKEIIWDFDGVILLSDSVREYGFKKIFESHKPENVKKLLKFHSDNGGLSRFVKIKYFYENILNQEISQDEIDWLANEFSTIMREALVDKKLINKQWLDLMDVISEDYVHSIASGSDGIELAYLCEKLNISSYFKFIKGSPTAKKDLVNQIINKSEASHEKFVLIGDAINDREAAEHNNIHFIGYHNIRLKDSGLFVDDLMDLVDILKK